MANKLVILSAPSGAGKTTIVKELLKQVPELEFSISAASRDQRPNEEHGKDYHFLGVEGFKEAINNGEFVEWEEVYPDQFYGTLKSELDRIWNNNKHVVFDMDVVGGMNLKNQFGNQALAVFIQPPSEEELERRLRSRQTESDEKIAMRLGKAKQELSRSGEFDVVIVNDDLSEAVEKAVQLVQDFLKD